MSEDENVQKEELKFQNNLNPQENISEDIYQNSKNENNNLDNKIKQINEQNKIYEETDLNQEKSNMNENLNINLEKEKKEEELKEENMNKINIISNNEEENNEEIESLKIDDYLNQQKQQQEPQEQEIFINNDEYDDTDLHSCRLTQKNITDKYLLIKEDKNKNNQNSIKTDENSDNDDEEEKEDLFPFRIIGDVKKKSEYLGKYNNRYLELDSKKGLLKRYMSSKEYPKNPREIIDIRNFKLIKTLKLVKDYYDLEITYSETNKKGVKTDRIENFRLRHVECRDKWFNSLLLMWKFLIKGEPVPKITKNILLFVDDRIGIIQEIGRENKKNKKSEINLKKFKILGLLGVGGFGTVFKVKHILTDKIYAMKVMNKNYIIKKKFLHYIVSEFEIMKSLSGFPFVLDLHYCFQSANYLYIIIDYCPNGDFRNLKYLNNQKLFFAEVILAFEHIHNHNIIYRDLKPENILLDTTGHIRVCDFNLAKAGITRNKRADSFCGSPMYFSPEMLGGKGVDYRCDIYGIGLLMYEIVTGNAAYHKAKNLKVLYELIKKNQIDFKVPELNGDIKDLIEKILVKEPEKRLDIEEIKNHPYFKDIDFNKVLKKEYGKIETEKSKNKNKDEDNINENEKFKLEQQKLHDNKEFGVLDGKVSVKEMILDQKRVMKNYVREFYYVKKEDIELTKDYKLEVKEGNKGNINISSLIKDNYEYESY